LADLSATHSVRRRKAHINPETNYQLEKCGIASEIADQDCLVDHHSVSCAARARGPFGQPRRPTRVLTGRLLRPATAEPPPATRPTADSADLAIEELLWSSPLTQDRRGRQSSGEIPSGAGRKLSSKPSANERHKSMQSRASARREKVGFKMKHVRTTAEIDKAIKRLKRIQRNLG
jgi:hypothetical protein